MVLLTVMLSTLLSLLATPSWATTYYVSTTGSNSNDGLTVDTAWLTINKAVDTMVAGDTTYVRGGTYVPSTTIRFDVSGTASSPIRLLNYPGEAPVIDWAGTTSEYRILIQHSGGENVAMGYLEISGFEIKEGYDGIKFYSMHNSTISRNWIHSSLNQGIIGIGGHHNTFDRNIINHNGSFSKCDNDGVCNQAHGLYLHGDSYVITRNLIYDNVGYGIQMNGSDSSVYSSAKHPSSAFAGAANWIVSDNTFAYSYGRAGITVWGGLCGNLRLENNIFYQNAQVSPGEPQGVKFTSTTCTGVQIRNNHFYATSPGGTTGIGSGATEGVHYTQSGNVTNVSAPPFVNAPSTVPASPDFSLTASSPVNIARTNEFLNNSTNVVGAFKTIADPTASIHGNAITLTFPMSTAVPIQIPSAIGVAVGCAGANCPGSAAVSAATRKTGTDSQADVTISGISSDACVATDQDWTISYFSITGGWTGFDDIGPYPGLHQKVFSHTDLAVQNLCDGTGPGSGVGSPLITYKFDEGGGATAANTGSSGSADNGTLANGAGWTTGKTGYAVDITGGTQQVQVPYGSGVNPTTQSMTWVLAVKVPAGGASATRFDFGGQIGTNQRAYVGAISGTWRVASQSTSLTGSAASNLIVDEGWNHLCVNWNASTDTVTLYKNGVAGTGGATRSYTSFAMASDILLGITGTGFPAAMAPGAYDDFHLYTSVEDCATIYADWLGAATGVGTFGMPSYRFQAVYLPELGGSPTNFGTAINQAKTVIAGGAVAVVLEIYCENVADCEASSFRLESRQNGTGGWTQVPDVENNTKIYMWGSDTNTLLNAGVTTSRLSAGSCTVTNGVTLLTSAQVPVYDLPQDGCVVLRYIVRIGETSSGYHDLRVSKQGGEAFAGTVNAARITVVEPQASAQ